MGLGVDRRTAGGDLSALTDVFARVSLRRLVQDAAAFAAERGFEAIAVTANPHAFFFYDALGFVADGEIQTAFGSGQRMHLAVAPERS